MKNKSLNIILMTVLFLTVTACASTAPHVSATVPDKAVPGPILELPPELLELFPELEIETKRPDMSLFWEVYDLIREYGYDPNVKNRDLIDGAIKGLVEAVDRYSHYETPDETALMEAEMEGKFFGIGISFQFEDGALNIQKVFPKSPAEKAGIKAGDLIVEVDGEGVSELGKTKVVLAIRGEKGAEVKLKIWRKGWKEARIIAVIRDEVKFEVVESKLIERNGKRLAHIKVEVFSEATIRGFSKAIITAKSKWKVDGVIIDLRNNPGGRVDVVLKMASAWLGIDKPTFVDKNRAGEINPAHSMLSLLISYSLVDMPTVVLINNNSASASEILAGALQDYELATIVGVTSYGKGTVQAVIPLSNQGVLALTIRHWMTPTGRPIDRKGIVPDITVKSEPDGDPDTAHWPKSTKKPKVDKADLQLEKAIEVLSK